MSDNIITHLEDLPNELFRNVFDYLSIRNLYRAFVGLNKRIDDILQSIDHVSVTLWSSESANDPSVIFFASYLARLMIVNDSLDKIDLTCFSNVRSLKLKYPSKNQIYQLIQSEQLHYLEFLSIGFVMDLSPSSLIFKLYQYIFSDRFPFLHSCTLTNTPNTVSNWSISPALQSLTIHGSVTLPIYNAILDSCPNLVRLILYGVKDDSTLSPVVSSHHCLNYLSIRITKWSTDTIIDSLLIHAPKLQHFRMKILQPISKINFTDLAFILLKRVPRLCRFDCDMIMYKYTIDIDVVHRLHPCFMHIVCNSEYGRFHIFTKNSNK